jgi:hypothetical protein
MQGRATPKQEGAIAAGPFHLSDINQRAAGHKTNEYAALQRLRIVHCAYNKAYFTSTAEK